MFRIVWKCWAEKSLQWNFIVECCKEYDCSKDFTTQGSVRTGIKILYCWRDEIECVLVLPVPAESRCRFLSCFLFWNGLRIGGFGQCLFCFSLSIWVFSFPERPCPAAFHSLVSQDHWRFPSFSLSVPTTKLAPSGDKEEVPASEVPVSGVHELNN